MALGIRLAEWVDHNIKLSCNNRPFYFCLNGEKKRVITIFFSPSGVPGFGTATEYLSLMLRNALVTIGASEVVLCYPDQKLCHQVKKCFYKSYNNFTPTLKIDALNYSWSDNKAQPFIKIAKKVIFFDDLNYKKSETSITKCLCINIGQSEIKICAIHENSWQGPLTIYPVTILKSNPSDKAKNHLLNIVKLDELVQRYIQELPVIYRHINHIVVSVGALTNKNGIVPIANGIVDNFGPDQISHFSQQLKYIGLRLGLTPEIATIVNDGELLAFGSHQENYLQNEVLTIRIGTSLCAGVNSTGVLGEIGWLLMEKTEQNNQPLAPYILSNQDGLLRNKLSASKISNSSHLDFNANDKRFKQLLRPSYKKTNSTKEITINSVSECLADMILVMQQFFPISHVVFGGNFFYDSLPSKTVPLCKEKYRSFFSHQPALTFQIAKPKASSQFIVFDSVFTYLRQIARR